MPSKSPNHTRGRERCNQPRSHHNPAPTSSKSSKCTPGLSRYERQGERGGWYYTAWRLRRSVKVRPTSQPQDLIRCYEAMTPGIYKANLAAKEQADARFCFREDRRPPVQPASYKNLLLPKRKPKKDERGTGNIGRRKTLANGLRGLGKEETRVNIATSRNSASESKRKFDQPVDSGHCHDSAAQVSQKSRKTLKQVRFDEDSEWIDISKDDVPEVLVEPEWWIFSMHEDEYILLQ
ncbi:hypothetical protein N431DRAFT_465497 [Stipitochalara longipes BDJ]|nr:hypothetical protein N431DRAFT_465497 [Stipitochalara longipes BDJ]